MNHALYTFLLKEEKDSGIVHSSRDTISWAAQYLIAQNFWPQQLLRVRKLTDPGSLHGNKGVISLLSLLTDIKDNISHLPSEPNQTDKLVRQIEEIQKQIVAASRKIHPIINKFIAHPATQQSIKSDPLSSTPIDIDEFWECVKMLATSARSIERYIFKWGDIPTSPLQVNINPWIENDEYAVRLNQHLEDQRREVGSWRAWNLDEIT